MHRFSIFVGVAAALAAQNDPDLALGFQSQVVFQSNSAAYLLRGFTAGAAGEVYAGVGNQLLAIDAAGNPSVLWQFAPGSGVGVLARLAGNATVWFSEDLTSRAWHYDPGSGAITAGTLPLHTFDLESAPTGELLAAANPRWPAPNAQAGVWLVDFASGQHREIVALTGPSGPLAFDRQGDLWYALQSAVFPTPPGSVKLLRFDGARVQAALQGGAALALSDGVVALGGLDGAFDLAFDDRGRLLLSDPQHGGLLRTVPGGSALEPIPLLQRPTAPSSTVTLQLQFVEQGSATLDAYQPDTGGDLFVLVNDWQQRAEVLRVRAQRPVLTLPAGGVAVPGPVALTLDHLPPGGAVCLCASLAPLWPERPVAAWNGVPIWSSLDWNFPVVPTGLRADANGQVRVMAAWVGGRALTVHFEAWGLDLAAPGLVSAAAGSLQLVP